MKNSIKYLLVIFLLSAITGCKIYSFSGANINPDIKSVSIGYFNNDSGNGPPIVSDFFTNEMKNKMITNTNLAVKNNSGDVQFEGNIIGYAYSIQAPTGNTSSDLRRITITAKVNYTNFIEPEDSWEQEFSRYAEYQTSQSLADIEESLIDEICTLIVDDIFNKAFVKW